MSERPLRLVDEEAGAEIPELRPLQRILDAALAYLSEEELLQELLQRIAEILAPDTVAILLLEGEELHARAAKGIEEEVEQGVRIPLGRGFAGRIAAERRPIRILDVDHADIMNPILREKGIRSLLGVPLLVEDRVIGVLHVGSLTTRVFTDEETGLLQLAADRAALSIERARLYEQRRIAEVLQRQLLPGERPSLPDLEAAGRYRPASGASLGGDWYDAFPLSGGRMALVVGDVVGHGVGAAAAMGQLRTAVRAYAIEDHPPATVLERVNELMLSSGPLAVTTLAYVVIDPAKGWLEAVSAGHPPPLIIAPDGTATFLAITPGMPLGALPTPRAGVTRVPFESGAIVLLYTDGLVEERRVPIDVGLERLRATAEGADDVEALCETLLRELVPMQQKDDIAFVAARVPPLPAELRTTWPATLSSLARARNVLRRWLAASGAGEHAAFDLLVASQEACANAIEHAYSPGDAVFELNALVADGAVRITVRDAGEWRPPRPSARGRGLPMMKALVDELDVRRGESGTEVVLVRALGGAA